MFIAFDVSDMLPVLLLIFMEGVLSLDNALVLALVVRHLPPKAQRKALTYGIWGAFIFRIAALFLITRIFSSYWIRIVGGGYLVYLAVKYFAWDRAEEQAKAQQTSAFAFWRVVVTVELLDMVFSLDSILASVAVSQKLAVVVVGGLLGIVMMRLASSLFVTLLNWFPRIEGVAYVIVGGLGAKLVAQGLFR